MKASDAENANRLHWDEVAPVHEKSYDIPSLKSGKSQIDKYQQNELYPITGKSLLHLQCHIGTDSISLALDGAKVTGIDYSERSIEIAKKLNSEMGTQVNFLVSNVFDAPDILKEQFDIVYTSKGVLTWISDIKRWGKTVSAFLRPGGTFYIMEIHPAQCIFDDTVAGDLVVKNPYFHNEEPFHWDDDNPDYSDRTYIPKNKTYEWFWSISDVMNALIENGLTIEKITEYDKLFYKGLPGMIKDADGWWYLEKYKGKIPFAFSLRARK